MDTIIFTRRFVRIVVVVSFAIAAVACGRSSPLQQDTNVASEPTAAWVAAFNAGDPAALAALYAEDARSLPPGDRPWPAGAKLSRTGEMTSARVA